MLQLLHKSRQARRKRKRRKQLAKSKVKSVTQNKFKHIW
jgi:hypothetical protein